MLPPLESVGSSPKDPRFKQCEPRRCLAAQRFLRHNSVACHGRIIQQVWMHRAYLSVAASGVSTARDSELYGELALKLPFAVEPAQRAAWEYEIQHLRLLARELPDAHFMLEFLIPRMGRRADLVVLLGGVVFVVEYKIGARHFERSGLDQVYGYGLDLIHFHEPSHALPVVPIAARYGELTIPVGIMFAKGDLLLDPSVHGQPTVAAIKGAELKLIDGGHMFPLKQPRVTADWIMERAKT